MRKKILLKRAGLFSNYSYINKRELGYKKKLGFDDELTKKLNLSLDICYKCVKKDTGGIFNLEFSLDGSILGAACEQKSIYLYDSLNQRLIKSIQNAHTSCVNCIKFLDTYTFASGSDDTTINLWDIRFLKEATRTLRNHGNWVKNIEHCPITGKLLTSAFDGTVRSWDLKNFTESGVVSSRLINMDGLMRMKITPDGQKMVICATSGYIMIIHDLNLEYLSSDLQRFRPNLYRLMQISEQNIPIASSFNYLFSLSRRRNRVELISDFPNEAEVISSLQIHPMGWSVLSRNITSDDQTEWTCVHDIQERPNQESIIVPLDRNYMNGILENVEPGNRNLQPLDIWLGTITNRNVREQRSRLISDNRGGTGIRTNRTSVSALNSGMFTPENELNFDNTNSDERWKIIKNHPRLTHYIDESCSGKGFIKEVCFSTDGRIICSPYESGVRLFSFNSNCNELSTCVPEHPQKLTMIANFKEYHPEIVVSCKFNPYHCLLVSGCLGGQINWYQPIF